MQVLNKYKVKKAVASSTVNSIVTDLLNLYQTESYQPNNHLIYQKVASSDYLQNSYFEKTHPGYIKPILCQTITDIDDQVYQLKYTRISVTSFCKQVLKNTSIVDKIIKEQRNSHHHQSPDIESPKDAQFFSRIRGYFKLEIYLDDSQIAPSGIFNKTQKFLCVYITAADVPYQFRVKNEDISILLLVNRNKLKNLNLKDQYAALFSEVREEIMMLHTNGLIVTDSKGQQHTIKVAISTILGDNLGIYQFLGFKSSFQNRAFVCRFCSAKGKAKNDTESDIQELFSRKKLIQNPREEEYSQIGVKSSFALDNIGGVNRWNVAPPDAVRI